jgi:hypothetical protein
MRYSIQQDESTIFIGAGQFLHGDPMYQGDVRFHAAPLWQGRAAVWYGFAKIIQKGANGLLLYHRFQGLIDSIINSYS